MYYIQQMPFHVSDIHCGRNVVAVKTSLSILVIDFLLLHVFSASLSADSLLQPSILSAGCRPADFFSRHLLSVTKKCDFWQETIETVHCFTACWRSDRDSSSKHGAQATTSNAQVLLRLLVYRNDSVSVPVCVSYTLLT